MFRFQASCFTHDSANMVNGAMCAHSPKSWVVEYGSMTSLSWSDIAADLRIVHLAHELLLYKTLSVF